VDDVRVLPLLPNISGVAYQANLTMNLVALGFQPGTIPGFTNTFLGPFNNFDARLLLTQKLFDLSAIRNFQAGRAGVRVAELHEALAREQVASRTGLIYLEALRADRSVVAAQANVDLAEALLKLAHRISAMPGLVPGLTSRARKQDWPNSKSASPRLKPHPSRRV